MKIETQVSILLFVTMFTGLSIFILGNQIKGLRYTLDQHDTQIQQLKESHHE